MKIGLYLFAIACFAYFATMFSIQEKTIKRIECNQYTIMVESLISDNIYYHIIELLGDECSDKEIWEYYQKNINKLEIESVWIVE